MKKIIVLFLLIHTFSAFAEEGEFQFFAGAGAHIPLKQYSGEGTVYLHWGASIPLSVMFGISDNFDIGFCDGGILTQSILNGTKTYPSGQDMETDMRNVSNGKVFKRTYYKKGEPIINPEGIELTKNFLTQRTTKI